MPSDISLDNLNPGQVRKIRIIEKEFGQDWRTKYPGMAVDAVYNLAIEDDRKSLFCKIDRNRKDKLTEMLSYYDATMGDFIGMMIDEHYERYQLQRKNIISGIAEDFTGIKV